jgi:hypothetical protein
MTRSRPATRSRRTRLVLTITLIAILPLLLDHHRALAARTPQPPTSAIARAATAHPKNPLAERGLIHVMGPSPAIVPGAPGAWDDWLLECSDIIKDGRTYYWYYHARGGEKRRPKTGYRIGVATAHTPLGPWTRYGGNPILTPGPAGSWDSEWVACACVMKERAYGRRPDRDMFYMWYSGGGPTGTHIGLATAPSPLGPWTKLPSNPVLKDFGYLGSVVKVNGRFFMYNECPVSATSPDQGPMAVATTDRPEGPWTRYEHNPVLAPGDWGAWDDGGYSEAAVRYSDGVFHWFYGGTKARKLESVGYAYSYDGLRWTKYPGNPIIPLTRIPDASACAEVKALIEPPNIYLYHTLRYFSRLRNAQGDWATEHLAVQVLTTAPTFRVAFPVMQVRSLPAGRATSLKDCCPISFDSVSGCALTIAVTCAARAKAGLRLHVRSSSDGIAYDTTDLRTFDLTATPGASLRRTFELTSSARFLKVTVENLDRSIRVRNLQIMATLAN